MKESFVDVLWTNLEDLGFRHYRDCVLKFNSSSDRSSLIVAIKLIDVVQMIAIIFDSIQ